MAKSVKKRKPTKRKPTKRKPTKRKKYKLHPYAARIVLRERLRRPLKALVKVYGGDLDYRVVLSRPDLNLTVEEAYALYDVLFILRNKSKAQSLGSQEFDNA